MVTKIKSHFYLSIRGCSSRESIRSSSILIGRIRSSILESMTSLSFYRLNLHMTYVISVGGEFTYRSHGIIIVVGVCVTGIMLLSLLVPWIVLVLQRSRIRHCCLKLTGLERQKYISKHAGICVTRRCIATMWQKWWHQRYIGILCAIMLWILFQIHFKFRDFFSTEVRCVSTAGATSSWPS